ncbi:MAG: tetratricopeptide repeat protein [Chloroflexi bacterium]|nr:tetratricopeptide repeat protein [Chloroflexota bacterium]
MQRHPRHVETYRLLGKALLEQQKYTDAADVFHRVLSADPEDFISHAGLAIIYKEEGIVPQAIWHMERAYEAEPYNAAIQQELKDLYGRRDGLEPERLNLTRAALARLYFRGGLYQQASAELRRILADQKERLDLLALLAETLWRDDQRVDAVDVCMNILDQLPNCIKANAILAEVWLVTGRIDEAQEYLQRLRALTLLDARSCDPETPIGRAFSANGGVALPERVMIEQLDYVPSSVQMAGETSDWVQELGIGEGKEVPDWLQEIGESGSEFFGASEEQEAGDEGMLNWLREVAVAGGDPFAEKPVELFGEETAEAPAETFEWFEEAKEPTTTGQQRPEEADWLSELNASAEADMWESMAAGQSPAAGERKAGKGAADMPDWLQEFQEETPKAEELAEWDAWQGEEGAPGGTSTQGGAGTPKVTSEPQEEDFAAWMSEPAGTTQGAAELGDMPDWLQAPDEAAGAEEFPEWLSEPAGEKAETPAAAELPDWLGEMAGEETAAEEGAEDSVPEWLSEPAEMATLESAAPGPETEGLPDWLSEVGAEETVVAAGVLDWLSEPAGEATEAAESEELPDWLGEVAGEETAVAGDRPGWLDELAGEAAVAPEAEELPDWLSETAGEETVVAASVPDWLSEPAGEEAVAASVLDWLGEPTGEATEAAESEELPDWLGEVAGEETAVAGDRPEWLDELAGEAAAAPEAEELPDWLDETAGEETIVTAGRPEWLDELAGEAAAAPEAEELPDWLSETAAEAAVAAGVLDWLSEPAGEATEAAESEELPDWLGEVAGEETAVAGDRPEWLDELAGEAATAAEAEELPDWLDETAGEEAVAANVLDWLGEPTGEVDETAAAEELPEWLAETVDVGPDWPGDGSGEEKDEQALSGWLSELDETEEGVMVLTEEPENGQEAPEEELDEAMKWLEELAAQQGAPPGELPSLLQKREPEVESGEEAPDWLQMDLESELPGGESLPDWMGLLDQEPAGAVTGEEVLWPAIEDTGEPAVPSDDIPEWLRAQMPEDLSQATGAEESDGLSWLDQIAAGEGAAIEEPPTLRWEEAEQEEPAGDLAWLDNLSDLGAGEVGTLFAGEEITTEWAAEPAAEAEGGSEEEISGLLDEMLGETDEAMTWLEELAAQQDGPMEELPTVVDQVEVEPLILEEPIEFSWEEPAAEPLAEVEAIEEMETLAIPMEEVDLATLAADIPEDPDEAMAWLERLAAQQGAPLEELPMLVDQMELEPTLLDEPAELPWEEPVTEPMAESLAEPVDELMAELFAEPLIGMEALEELEVPETPAEEMEQAALTADIPEDPDEAMAWLERLAAQQGAPLEELPTVMDQMKVEPAIQEEPLELSWEELESEPSVETLDELMAELFAEPLVEMEAAVLEEPMEGLGAPGEEVDLATLAAEVPEDMDEAMAWLEQLAAQQGAPLEELPTVVDRMEIEAEEMASAGELLTELELEAEEVDLSDVEMPGDVDEALAWLEELMGGPPVGTQAGAVPPAAPEVVEEPPTPAVAHDVVAAQREAEAILAQVEAPAAPDVELMGEMPEDPEAAMAWLEQLAARQGAPLEELISVESAGGEVEMPDWVAQEMAQAPPEAFISPGEEAPEMEIAAEAGDFTWPAGVEETVIAEPLTLEELAPALEETLLPEATAGPVEVEAPALEESSLLEVDSALPDWLSFEPTGAARAGEIDWLDEFAESDVDSWLAAEEIISLELPKTGELPPEVVSGEPAIAVEVEPEMAGPEMAEPEMAEPFLAAAGEEEVASIAEARPEPALRAAGAPGRQQQLEAAHRALEYGNYQEAVEAYSTLLSSGQSLPLLIADLEGAVAVHGRQATLRRLLGDAYMRNGQLQKALDSYRQALDQI